MSFNQSNRLLTLIGPDDNDDIVPQSIQGTEAISDEFVFTLQGVSTTTDIVSQAWLGKRVTVKIHNDTQEKIINGVVQQFAAGELDGNSHRHYNLIIVPWFSALDLQQDCRIFQQLSIPKIFQQLCQELGFAEIDISQLGRQYPTLSYVTQYNETTRYFLKRILNAAGIYYSYRHSENGHVLTLYDDLSTTPANPPIVLTDQHPSGPHFYQWGNVATAELQFAGESNVFDLAAAQVFALQMEEESTEYRALSIEHEAHDVSYSHAHGIEVPAQHYHNRVLAQAKTAAIVLPQLNKPLMHGPQPAFVTGAQDKAIYTDALGRVKVHFIWDRKGSKNENSSCWLTPTQPLSSCTQFIPRIGDEVIVDFLDGDIDRPVIIGSSFNASNQPIFPPDQPISGFKTRLVTGNQTQAGHELSFDDTRAKEKITLHSAGALQIDVANDLLQTTNQNETITVQQQSVLNILQGSSSTQAKEICLKAGGSELLINSDGIQFQPSGKLLLKAPGVGGSFPLARVGDKSQCPRMVVISPDIGGPLTKGSTTTKAGGLQVARVGDPLACQNSNDAIKKGADNILVDGKPVAHLNSQTEHGGVVQKGSDKVVVMDRG